MRLEIRLSDRAQKDIQSITNYSLEIWGEAQATQYLEGLSDLFDKIADMPGFGRARPEISRGLRSVRYRSHCVYYQPQDDYIRVAAVLHQAQDFQQQLGTTE